MKKFVWRLQRLLDIKIKQEDAMRAELIAITERSVSVRSLIMMRKVALRERLTEIGETSGKNRLDAQRLFLRFAHVIDEEIKRLESDLAELEKVRQAKIKEIIEIRKFRKGLEKLRDEAKAEFIKEQERREQADLDDKTTTTFARKIMQQT